MEPSEQKEPVLSENNKRGKLVGKLLVGIFTLLVTLGGLGLFYEEESRNGDSKRAIDSFEKAIATYILQGGKSEVDPLGGLQTSNTWHIEIEKSIFVLHESKKQTRAGVEEDVDARVAALENERKALEKAANALRNYKNQSIAKGKIYKSVALYNQQTAQNKLAGKATANNPTSPSIAAPLFDIHLDNGDVVMVEHPQMPTPEEAQALIDNLYGSAASSNNETTDSKRVKFIAKARATSKTDEFGGILVGSDVPTEFIEHSKNAAMPWSIQSNLTLYSKVVGGALIIGLLTYIGVRFFVFVTVLLWWFMIDRIKDISRAIKG